MRILRSVVMLSVVCRKLGVVRNGLRFSIAVKQRGRRSRFDDAAR